MAHEVSGSNLFEIEALRTTVGPDGLDQLIKQAIMTCWMLLPSDRKTFPEVEAQMRRLVERTLANMKEDRKAFGFPEEGQKSA